MAFSIPPRPVNLQHYMDSTPDRFGRGKIEPLNIVLPASLSFINTSKLDRTDYYSQPGRFPNQVERKKEEDTSLHN